MPIAKKTYHYEGATLPVTRTSSASATVALQCGMHEHGQFIIGLMENDTWGWVVGREESGSPHDGNFVDAVDHAADLLIEECNAMVQVDTFFSDNQ